MELDEFDPIVERLRAAGATFDTRLFEDGGLREVYALDPMGKTVEVYAEEPPDPAWERSSPRRARTLGAA